MAYKKLHLRHILAICWLYCYSINCDDTKPTVKLIPGNDWEVINTGWPVQDYEDSVYDRQTQFYYVKNSKKSIETNFTANFLNEMSQLKNSTDTFLIKFKYWTYYVSEGRIATTKLTTSREFTHDTASDYKDFSYVGDWKTFEFAMQYEDLKDFHLINFLTYEDNLIAYKDINLIYETLKIPQTYPNVMDTNENSLNNWQKYLSPPTSDGAKFLYFSNECNHGCTINFTGIDFKLRTYEAFIDYQISYKYWIKFNVDSTKIVLNANSKVYTNEKNTVDWEVQVSDPVTDFNSLTKTIINISTKKDTDIFTSVSYVAIKDLKVVIKTNLTAEISFNCETDSCFGNLKEKLIWREISSVLPLDGTYYYPISNENSIKLFNEIADRTKTDITYELQYMATTETTLKISHNAANESQLDNILRIKPKISKTVVDKTTLSLNQYLAFISKKSYTTISVSQNNFTPMNSFVLNIKKLAPEPDTNNKPQNFLQAWNKINLNSRDISWKDEWKIQVPEASVGFDNSNDDKVTFTGYPESRSPASAQYISNWLRYNHSLHLVNPKYSVQVTNKKNFTGFSVKPRICDSLMHCIDVVIVSEQKSSDNLKIDYSFRFAKLNTDYIKLVFYIEYFLPPDGQINAIVFDLRLVHFGDPCYLSSSCNTPNIPCEKKLYGDFPNTFTCDCPKATINNSDNCSLIDYCKYSNSSISPIWHNGRHICDIDKLGCEAIINGYRCECVNGNKVSPKTVTPAKYNDVTNMCHEISEPTTNAKTVNWQKTPEGKYFATNTNNALEIKFENNNVDVCVKITYDNGNEELKNLIVNYTKNGTSNSIELMNLALPTGKDIILFCVRDFLYDYDENFSFILKINTASVLDLLVGNFSLELDYQAKKVDKKHLDKSLAWKLSNILPTVNLEWIKSIPENKLNGKLFNNEIPKQFDISFKTKVESKNKATFLVLSNWFKASSTYSSPFLYYSFRFGKLASKKSAKDYLEIYRAKIITVEPGKSHQILEGTPNGVLNDADPNFLILENNRLALPTNANAYFKVVFELTYSLRQETTPVDSIEVVIDSVSIGDPCYNIDKKLVCGSEKNECITESFSSFSCVCNDGLTKPLCNIINNCNEKYNAEYLTREEYCQSLPSIQMLESKETCESPSNTTWKCKCPDNGFEWRNERCVRTGVYQKYGKYCSGKNCDFLNNYSNEFAVSNINLPKIDKDDHSILPFYYPLKSDAELKITFDNYLPTKDACINLNYYVTNGSRIDVNFNSLQTPAFQISPTLKLGSNGEEPQWVPELFSNKESFCVRRLSSAIDSSFNVSFRARFANIDNDLVAVKFDTDNLVKTNDSWYPTEIKYITHISHPENISYDKDGESLANLWPIRFPNSLWRYKNVTDSISHKQFDYISFEDELTTASKTAYILSNWLPKDVDGYVLRFYVKDVQNNDSFTVLVDIVDSSMKSRGEIIVPLNNASIRHELPIPKVDTTFRVIIKAHYQLKDNSKKNTNLAFSLVNIDLGDPCVLTDGDYNSCSGNGTCARNAVNNFTCNCREKDIGGGKMIRYMGELCELLDFCSMDYPGRTNYPAKQYCADKKYEGCINLDKAYGTAPEFQFACKCNETTYWNNTLKSCEPIRKCLSHKCDLVSQVCVEPANKTDAAYCECRAGLFVTVSAKDDKTNVRCEQYNPCNATHRNQTADSEPYACSRTNVSIAYCFPIENYNLNERRKYECICPKNFETISTLASTTCIPNFCDSPALNPCNQKCEPITVHPYYNCSCNENYDKQGEFACKLKADKNCTCNGTAFCQNNIPTDCYCTKGFKYSGDGCVADITQVNDQLCGKGKINVTADGKNFTCECETGFKFNEQDRTCDYESPCDVKVTDGKTPCDASALCIIDEANIHNARCLCPEGTVFNDGDVEKNSADSVNMTCEALCSVGGRTDRCKEKYAKCNANNLFKLIEKTTKKLNSNVTKTAQYCDCNPGFLHFDSVELVRECKVAKFSTEFGLVLKNVFDDNVNNTLIKPEPRFFSEEIVRTKRQTLKDNVNNIVLANYLLVQAQKLIEMNRVHRTQIDQSIFAETVRQNVMNLLSHNNFGVDGLAVEQCETAADNNVKCNFVAVTQRLITAQELNKTLLDIQQSCQKIGTSGNCFFPDVDDFTIASSSIQGNLFNTFKACSQERGANYCPEYTTCVPQDNNFFSCKCNTTFFKNYSSEMLPNQENSQNYVIERCKVRELCEQDCPSHNSPANPHGYCVQEAPTVDKATNQWRAKVQVCGCEKGYWTVGTSAQCVEICPIGCNDHGTCKAQDNVGFCVCEEGWSGEKCTDEKKASVGGWIAGIVVLAVLVVVVAIVALIFARRSRGGDTSSAHAMDEYSHTSYRVGQQSSATARSQPSAPIVHASSGRDNKGFSRD